MEEKSGCLNWISIIALAIALYYWLNNVDTVTIVQQIPPPQDSWDVVYPQFRDDVSAQLLNTQKMTKGVLDETAYLKAQNADLQYSVDLLLSNLGILKKESYEESIRQRNEQRIMSVASLLLGWWLGAFVTRDRIKEIQKKFSRRKKINAIEFPVSSSSEEALVGETNSLSNSIPDQPLQRHRNDTLLQKLPQAARSPTDKLFPKCAVKMNLIAAPTGEEKGKLYYVCPNFKECKQYFPQQST